MKNKTSYLLAITGLLFIITAGVTAVVRFISRTTSTITPQTRTKNVGISLSTVITAHLGSGNAQWSRFIQKATMRDGSYSTMVQGEVETKLSLATDGRLVRYDRTTLNLNQSYFLNGNILIRTTFNARHELKVKTLEGVEADRIKSQIWTFGILPMLKHLSDPATNVLYVGNKSGEDQFEVKGRNSSWYFYSNSKHLIERLQFEEYTIAFDDYRQVEGLNLPFYQKLSKGDRIISEIQFNDIDLDPVFASDTFKSPSN